MSGSLSSDKKPSGLRFDGAGATWPLVLLLTLSREHQLQPKPPKIEQNRKQCLTAGTSWSTRNVPVPDLLERSARTVTLLGNFSLLDFWRFWKIPCSIVQRLKGTLVECLGFSSRRHRRSITPREVKPVDNLTYTSSIGHSKGLSPV